MELHTRDVSKTYPNGVQAVKDVTLTIPAGMYGLLGRNGAGRSTLMRILATLQDPGDGSIRLGEIDVVFAPGKVDGADVPLYLQRHRIRSGKQTIRITVPKEAGRAGIDPSHKLIDLDREDNVVEVKAAEAGDTL